MKRVHVEIVAGSRFLIRIDLESGNSISSEGVLVRGKNPTVTFAQFSSQDLEREMMKTAEISMREVMKAITDVVDAAVKSGKN